MVTHDQEEALTMADRIILMNKGIIEQEGSPYELYSNPKTSFAANFIGTTNLLEANKISNDQVEINAHYRGYLKKQKADILAFKRDENLIIPDKINYDLLNGLSNEVKSKFKQIRPKTMGQALRIDGITPAAAYILLSHVKRKSIKQIA